MQWQKDTRALVRAQPRWWGREPAVFFSNSRCTRKAGAGTAFLLSDPHMGEKETDRGLMGDRLPTWGHSSARASVMG